jgi:ATP-dependent RNA helicase DDX21
MSTKSSKKRALDEGTNDAVKKGTEKNIKPSKKQKKKEKKAKKAEDKKETTTPLQNITNGVHIPNGHTTNAQKQPVKETKEKEKEGEEKEEEEEEEAESGSGSYSWAELGEKGEKFEGPHFSKFRVSPETIKILEERGFKCMFPIQAMTFDHIFDGKDLIGRARTGSGKTLSFALPVIERLLNESKTDKKIGKAPGRLPRVLCLSPTRELARQIAIEFDAIGRQLSTVCVYGGAPYLPQQAAMRKGIDIIVGTPGRVIDHIERGTLKLADISYVILDEADEMLNIGFQEAIEKILENAPAPDKRQTLLFSATIPPWVQQIAAQHTRPDQLVTVDLVGNSKVKTATLVRHMAICCPPQVREETLGDVIKVYGRTGRTIVFANTKAEANEIALNSSIRTQCQVLHGDIAQAQRELTLQGFRDGNFTCLVATDVAARGLDIPEVDLIVQTHPPRDKETYIHRSGRTARAGRAGTCITFFTKREVLSGELRKLETAVGAKFELIGTPQPADIIRVAGEQAEDLLDKVHDDMITAFSETANRIIKQRGETAALAAALATICGLTQPLKGRSLLTGSENYITIIAKAARPIQTSSYIVSVVKNCLQLRPMERVGDVALCVDGSAVVDIPTNKVDKLLSSRPPAGLDFSVAEQIPPLKPNSSLSGGGGGGRGGGSRGGGFANGNGGGYRGGGGGGRYANGGGGGGRYGNGGGNGGGYRGGRFAGRNAARSGEGGGYRGGRFAARNAAKTAGPKADRGF